MLRAKQHTHRDSGLTLVELLVAVIITGLLASVLFRVASDAGQSLQYQVDSVRNAQSAIRFAQAMRYDIAGSTDVYAYGAPADYAGTGPKDRNQLCSTWRSESAEIRRYHPLATALNNDRWTKIDNPTSSGFVRTLVSIKIRELIYDRANPQDSTWFEQKNLWAGYEIRSARPGSSDRPNRYYLWRVTCDSNSSGLPLADIATEERMLELGTSIPAAVSGITSLSCFDAVLTASACPVTGLTTASGSTASKFSTYTFAVPYTEPTGGKRAQDALKRLRPLSAADPNNTLLQRMTRRVNN